MSPGRIGSRPRKTAASRKKKKKTTKRRSVVPTVKIPGMKTNLEIEGDTFNVKKRAPNIVIDNGKGKKIPGKTVKIGDTTHVHVYPKERREREQVRKKKSLTVKEIIEDETRRHYAGQLKAEEKKLRDEVKKNLLRRKSEEEALNRHKLLILLRGSKEFRREFWGDEKLVHASDPFKNNIEYIKKIRGTKKWNEIMEKTKKSGKAWQDGSLLKKYEETLKNIINRHEYYSDKLNYKALFEKFGGSIEELCKITGLERIGFSLNPGTFIRLPYLREYRTDIAKMHNLAIVKAIDLYKRHEQSLAISKATLDKLERKTTSYEELKRKSA